MIASLVLLQAALTIAVAGPPTSPEYLPLHVAMAEGLFTAQQVSVTLRSTRSDAAAAEMLASGQAQLAATSLDSALRLGGTEGGPPRLVWALTAAPPVALLVAPGRTDTIRSAADLVGQTVAIIVHPREHEGERRGGRVSSVNMLFIGASNQLGAVESGLVASLTNAGRDPSLQRARRRAQITVDQYAAPAPRRRCPRSRPASHPPGGVPPRLPRRGFP